MGDFDFKLGTLLIAFFLLAAMILSISCGDDDDDDDSDSIADDDDDDDTGDNDDDATDDDDDDSWTFEYSVPLDPLSPWPKFRRNAVQNGRSPVTFTKSDAVYWEFTTGKGIFSTPVIDGDGIVYIGSADRYFYAINPDGTKKWEFLTDEIIDSSALLDDKGRVYFGSGDGYLYALNRDDGSLVWSFLADDPSVNNAFIRWFEGNVAMLADGTLVVPNDNFCTYAIDRDTGEKVWCFETSDQTWSLPAYNHLTQTLFIGNNYLLWKNAFAVNANTGQAKWGNINIGTSMVASPMLTSTDPSGLVVMGGFDGILRVYGQAQGNAIWTTGMRDHLYSSPAQMEDGTIIQAGADGTIYAVDPADGEVVWAFDTLEPIRSSPAIDGHGNIYVGSGEGRLFVLNPDGTLRWSIKLIDDDRNDLNASVALGINAAVVAGENGGVFHVPYDYCLNDGADDDRCTLGPGESLPDEGAFLMYAGRFGGLHDIPLANIDANQPLTFVFMSRVVGDTELALLDSATLDVTLTPAIDAMVDVSGDRRFITVVPNEPWTDIGGGPVTVRIEVDYQVDFQRRGLLFFGGQYGGSIDQTFDFNVNTRQADSGMPWPVPATPGDDAGIVEVYRIAAPLPTILPSYNQIGFDSIHYLVGLVEGDQNRAIAWGYGAKLNDAGDTVVDPDSRVRFPLVIDWDNGLITLINEDGFTIEFNGFPLPFEFFRIAGVQDQATKAFSSPAINARAKCNEIDFYGIFMTLLGYCNPDTQILTAFGASEFRTHGTGVQSAPLGLDTVTITKEPTSFEAVLTGSTIKLDEHLVGILVVDTVTEKPVVLNYVENTNATTDGGGNLTSVSLDVGHENFPNPIRVYLMIDGYPAYVEGIG